MSDMPENIWATLEDSVQGVADGEWSNCHDWRTQSIEYVRADKYQWRSMDSAPRDGKHIMLVVMFGSFARVVEGAFHGKWMNAADIDSEPLCWCPKVPIPNEFLPWTEEYKAKNGKE